MKANVLIYRKVCSWCHGLIQAGHGPTSHGICPACLAAIKAEFALRRCKVEEPQSETSAQYLFERGAR